MFETQVKHIQSSNFWDMLQKSWDGRIETFLQRLYSIFKGLLKCLVVSTCLP